MFEIINAHCLDALETLKRQDRKFDAIVADPPYCSGGFLPAQKMGKGAEKYSDSTKFLGTFSDGMTERVLYRFTEEWVRKALEVLNSPGYFFLFTDWRMIGTFRDAALEAGLFVRGLLTWGKGKNRTRPQKGNFSQTSEFIIWGTRDKNKSDVYVTESVFAALAPNVLKRIHPTQKPTELIERLFDILPSDARSICDPFSGSGSTGIAALKRGFNFVGIERDEQFARLSRERLQKFADLQNSGNVEDDVL